MAKITYDLVYCDKKYEMCFYQDLSGIENTDRLVAIEKFIKKAMKLKETLGNEIIMEILLDSGIEVENSTYKGIKKALDTLLLTQGKTIVIEPIKAPKGTTIYSTTNEGHDIYISDNVIAIGEKIWATY